jgi:hypothetical protein
LSLTSVKLGINNVAVVLLRLTARSRCTFGASRVFLLLGVHLLAQLLGSRPECLGFGLDRLEVSLPRMASSASLIALSMTLFLAIRQLLAVLGD